MLGFMDCTLEVMAICIDRYSTSNGMLHFPSRCCAIFRAERSQHVNPWEKISSGSVRQGNAGEAMRAECSGRVSLLESQDEGETFTETDKVVVAGKVDGG